MPDDFIQHAARLMREQANAYRQLNSATEMLAAALVNGAPALIASVTRAGESDLFKMRSRLVQIVSTLTAFSDQRAQSEQTIPISAEARSTFETASAELMEAARTFERTRRRTASLANNGAGFYAACIESCGVLPTTYRAPYARRGEANTWA